LSSTQQTPKSRDLGEGSLAPAPGFRIQHTASSLPIPFHPRAEPNINTAGKGQQTGANRGGVLKGVWEKSKRKK